MNRFYTVEFYLEQIERINSMFKLPFLGSDIIAGFAGETEEDFCATRDVMNEVGFDNAFIFKYSPRPGTVSAKTADNVPQEEKERRNQILLADLAERSLAHNRALIGTVQQVLAEGPSSRNPARWCGKTSTAKSVMFAPWEGIKIGDLVEVKIARASSMSLFADNIPDLPEC